MVALSASAAEPVAIVRVVVGDKRDVFSAVAKLRGAAWATAAPPPISTASIPNNTNQREHRKWGDEPVFGNGA